MQVHLAVQCSFIVSKEYTMQDVEAKKGRIIAINVQMAMTKINSYRRYQASKCLL